jgi:hypothetical protein
VSLAELIGGWNITLFGLSAPLFAWALMGKYGHFDTKEEREAWQHGTVVGGMLIIPLLLSVLLHQ